MRLKEVFRKFDLDRGGFLDCRELHKAMAWLGYGLTNEEVEQISNSCDVGGKGQLEEHEFFGFMRKVKEREIGLVKKALSRQRPDGNNVYMQKQLDRVLRTLGYIPNAQAIRDAAEDAGIIRANPAEERGEVLAWTYCGGGGLELTEVSGGSLERHGGTDIALLF
ncbi:unnamed protein product [Effrenium voratum]|nr:unnamed protein product [Effrenium voratum]